MRTAIHTLPTSSAVPDTGLPLTRRDLAACVAAGEGASLLLVLLLYVKSPERMGVALLSFLIFPLGMVAAAFLGVRLGKRFPEVAPASKFGVVGILNTTLDLSLLTLLVLVTGISRGPVYATFKATSFLAAAANSYLWNKHWSFAEGAEPARNRPFLEAREFLRFLFFTLIGLGVSTVVATLLVELVQPADRVSSVLWATGAAAIACMASAVWNFCAYRYLVFGSTSAGRRERRRLAANVLLFAARGEKPCR